MSVRLVVAVLIYRPALLGLCLVCINACVDMWAIHVDSVLLLSCCGMLLPGWFVCSMPRGPASAATRPTTRAANASDSAVPSRNKRTAPATEASGSPSKQRRVVQTLSPASEEVCPDTIARVTAEVIRQLRQPAPVHRSSSTSTAGADVPPACLPVEVATTASPSSGIMSGIGATMEGQPPPCTPGPSQSEVTWDGSVMHTIKNMLRGESTEQPCPPPIHLHSTPLGMLLPDRMKAKIWANEFVDFADLLYQHPPRPLSLALSPGNDKATFAIAHVGKGRQLQSIEQWTTAMLTFAAVYAQRHPQQAIGLFQYCEIVRDIAHTGPPTWRLYDEQFRSFRQSDPGNFPWDQPRWDLFFKTMYAKPAQNNSSRPFSSTAQQAKRTSYPTGYCWAFQRGTCQTRQCRFKHTCAKCDNAHPASQCQKPGPANPNKRGPVANRSKRV